jgi:hypothetical protein
MIRLSAHAASAFNPQTKTAPLAAEAPEVGCGSVDDAVLTDY